MSVSPAANRYGDTSRFHRMQPQSQAEERREQQQIREIRDGLDFRRDEPDQRQLQEQDEEGDERDARRMPRDGREQVSGALPACRPLPTVGLRHEADHNRELALATYRGRNGSHPLGADHVTPRRVQPAAKRPAGDERQPVVAVIAQHARVVESHDARPGDAVSGPASGASITTASATRKSARNAAQLSR